jgi:hypothetical protein
MPKMIFMSYLSPEPAANTGVPAVASVPIHVASPTGKDHCSLCYELYSVMKEEANENNEGYFPQLLSPEPSCDQISLSSFITY